MDQAKLALSWTTTYSSEDGNSTAIRTHNERTAQTDKHVIALTALLLEPWLQEVGRSGHVSAGSSLFARMRQDRIIAETAVGQRETYADSESVLDGAQETGLFFGVLVALV